MSLRRLVLLNPKSRNGQAAQVFARMRRELERELGPLEVVPTQGPGDATEHVRAALQTHSHDQILIAGGDGTVNEAVNGYFANGEVLSGKIPLGIINLGTGGDFYRTLVKQNPRYGAAVRENRFRCLDCGVSTLAQGESPRYFINISSIGLGGEVNRQMKDSAFQQGAAAYFWHSLTALMKYNAPTCRFQLKTISGTWEAFEAPLVNLFVCNAECSGGGMRWAPGSDFEDGVFDIVLVSGSSKLRMIAESNRIYSGEISKMAGVREMRGTEIVAEPSRPVSQEIDGEPRPAGDLEIVRYHFRIVPRCVPVIA